MKWIAWLLLVLGSLAVGLAGLAAFRAARWAATTRTLWSTEQPAQAAPGLQDTERSPRSVFRHERQLEPGEARWKLSTRWRGWASFRQPCEIHSAPRERR